MKPIKRITQMSLEVITSFPVKGSQGSSGSILSDYGLDDRCSIPGRGKRIFVLALASRPALGPIQPPVQWVPGVLSPGVNRGRGGTLTTHPPSSSDVKNELEPYLLSPHAPPGRVVGSLYLYLHQGAVEVVRHVC
jgi:hypothetical protein